MSYDPTWWMNNYGRTAAATSGRQSPQPDLALVSDIAQANLDPFDKDEVINGIETLTDDQDTAQAQLNTEMALAQAVQDADGDIFEAIDLLESRGHKDDRPWWKRAAGNLTDSVGGAIGAGVGWLGDRREDAIDFLQQNVDKPALSPWVGEDNVEKVHRITEEVELGVGDAMETSFRVVDQALATPVIAGSLISDQGSVAERINATFSGDTYSEAWGIADNVTFGQSLIDPFALDDSSPFAHEDATSVSDAYRAGFDEFSKPLDAAYADVRENSLAYNLTSGTADFLKAWYLDPVVVGLKGVSVARAMQRGDVTRMPRGSSEKVRRIVTASDEQLKAMHVRKTDLVGQRALTLREKMWQTADDVRGNRIDEVSLVEREFAFRDAPEAAALFVQAARAKKIDWNTGRLTDEYDNEFFRAAMDAAMGSPERLLAHGPKGQDLLASMERVGNQGFRALDELSEITLRDYRSAIGADLPPQVARERALTNPRGMDDAFERIAAAEESLRRFTAYQDWTQRAVTRASGSAVRAVPGSGASVAQSIFDVRTSAFRPAGINDAAGIYMQPPPAWLRRRPGVLDLHRPNEAYSNGNRYFDQMAKYAGEDVINTVGRGEFSRTRNDFLRRFSRATTDSERRIIAGEMEEYGISLVARKHGMSAEESRVIARQITDRRAGMFANIERQHQEARALRAAKDNEDVIGQVKFKDGDSVVTFDLPMTLTDLKNTHISTDLRALDGILRQHGRGQRNLMGQLSNDAVNKGTSALEFYNQLWKPSVLFRLGYPIRTVSDDFARGLAMVDNIAEYLGRSMQGLAIGSANLPLRLGSQLKRPYDARAKRRWESRNADVYAGDELTAATRIDPARLESINKSTAGVEDWRRRSLRAQVNGRKAPGAPPIVRKFDTHVARGESFSFDVAAGRKLKPNQQVHDLNLDVAETFRAAPSGTDLARFSEQHAELLSHVDGVVMVQKLGDGSWRATVGRKGPNKGFNLIEQRSMKSGVRVFHQRSGTTHDIEGPAAGPAADMYIPAASSGSQWQAMGRSVESNTANVQASMASARRTTIQDGHAHVELHADTINRRVLKDPVMRRLLDADDPDDVVAWLTRTAEGRAHAKRIPWRSHDPAKWTDEQMQLLNDLLPDDALRAKVRAGQEITPEELSLRYRNDPDLMPASIDEATVQMVTGEGAIAQAVNKVTDKAYHVLATLPTDTLARNPFFRDQYRAHFQRSIDRLEDGANISDDVMQFMAKQSREFALRQTRRYMFSLQDNTDLVHTMRFLSPFMGAWQETMIRWATIFAEKPEMLQRLWFQGWENLDSLFFLDMTDEEGRTKDDPDHGDLVNIRMPIPDAMKGSLQKLMPGSPPEGTADLMHTASFNKNSLMAVIQGEPFWVPGMGPVAQIPAAYGVRNAPWLADENSLTEFLHTYLFPTGIPDWTSAVMPAGWMQGMVRDIRGEDDPIFQNFAAVVHKTEIQRWEQEGKVGPKPRESESVQKANVIQSYMWIGRFLSPGSFRIEPGVPGAEHSSQYFMDAANRMYEEMPNADEGQRYLRYLDQYGDEAYMWWTSNSENATGIPATSKAHKAQAANADLIRDFPELGLAIVGVDTMDEEFNYYVYQQQEREGDRSRLSPADAQARAEAKRGWDEWRRYSQLIDSELAFRGMNTTQQRGAEDLAQLKAMKREELKQLYPGWREDFETFDTGRGYRLIDAIRGAVETGHAPDPRFRPDWRGIHDYLEVHDLYAAELDWRAMNGGSRDITAQANADLHAMFNARVGILVQENLEFADLYHVLLENHELTMGSGL